MQRRVVSEQFIGFEEEKLGKELKKTKNERNHKLEVERFIEKSRNLTTIRNERRFFLGIKKKEGRKES